MNRYVTDSTGLIRHLAKQKNIGKSARRIFEEADRGESLVFIPALVSLEIMYLSEKGRIPTTLPDVEKLIREKENYRIHPTDFAVVLKTKEIDDIPELHDRIIAASAAVLGLELISKDSIIKQSKFVKTIW